jgi:hypothetical protein
MESLAFFMQDFLFFKPFFAAILFYKNVVFM